MNYNYNMSKKYMNKLEAKIKEQQQRIDKAIDYIENNNCPDPYCLTKDILDILKGTDE